MISLGAFGDAYDIGMARVKRVLIVISAIEVRISHVSFVTIEVLQDVVQSGTVRKQKRVAVDRDVNELTEDVVTGKTFPELRLVLRQTDQIDLPVAAPDCVTYYRDVIQRLERVVLEPNQLLGLDQGLSSAFALLNVEDQDINLASVAYRVDALDHKINFVELYVEVVGIIHEIHANEDELDPALQLVALQVQCTHDPRLLGFLDVPGFYKHYHQLRRLFVVDIQQLLLGAEQY